MDNNGLPLGFGMALAQNAAALQKFASLTEPEKQTLINQAHKVNSKREMRRLVSNLADDPTVGI